MFCWAVFLTMTPVWCWIARFWLLSLLLQHFSPVQLFATPWTVAPWVLCPWDSPGKNTGVDHHSLLQGIFPTQESNPRLLCPLHWQMVSLPLPQLARLLVVNQVTKIFIIKFDRIARTCKQPKCSCIEEWIKKIYICTKEFIFLTQP